MIYRYHLVEFFFGFLDFLFVFVGCCVALYATSRHDDPATLMDWET